MIKRQLEDIIEKWLFRQKVITVYGARQVGKTTLVKEMLHKHGDLSGYFNCEMLNVRQALESAEPEKIKRFVGDRKIIVFDEAQQISDIGKVLKIFHDAYPDIQVIATGSSSFELANRTQEFLTGRGLEFILYPFSYGELIDAHGFASVDAQKEFYMLYGTYPEVCLSSQEDARTLLDNLTGKYLYKDILEFENVQKPDKLLKLLKLLAYQLGNEVSIHELTTALAVNRDTVERYLDLLEKAFVIFRLKAFSKNLRKEINKKEKVYFYDVGVRNSLISRFDDIGMRDDIGGLWENICIIERKKYLQRTNKVC
ncbi:MAG TPA: ATP-binding protein, partial [Candidatus Bathyarchaeia archaeon]|nr:ATP-binding protein [Candidatus Bathyarchaeia archaeon]